MEHKHQPNYKPHPGRASVLSWRSTPFGLPLSRDTSVKVYDFICLQFHTQIQHMRLPTTLMHVWLTS